MKLKLKRPETRTGFLIAGGVALAAGAVYFRREIYTGVANFTWFAAKGTADAAIGIASMGVLTLDSIASAADNVPTFTGAAYNLLPQGPAEPLPEKSITELLPAVQPKFIALQKELNDLLGPVGYEAVITETYRTSLRQLYLWGIGRFYQAPGRSGPVTGKKTASGKHPRRKAVDFRYEKIGSSTSKESVWLPVLKTNAKRLEAKYGMRWGGFWTSPYDPPHWEIA